MFRVKSLSLPYVSSLFWVDVRIFHPSIHWGGRIYVDFRIALKQYPILSSDPFHVFSWLWVVFGFYSFCRPGSPCLHSALPPLVFLVSSLSCSMAFFRSHHCPFPSLVLPSPPSTTWVLPLHLTPIVSYSVWNFPICMVIIHVLAVRLCAHWCSISLPPSGPHCLVKALLLLLQVCSHQPKRKLG